MIYLSVWSEIENSLAQGVSKIVAVICDVIYFIIGLFPVDNGIFFEKINKSRFVQYFKYIIWAVPLTTVLEIFFIIVGFIFTVEVLYYVIQLLQFGINTVRG